MKDRDSLLLEEIYVEMHKEDDSLDFTDEEHDALYEIGSSMENRDDQYVRVDTDFFIKGNVAAFKIEGAYSVDTQYETKWEPFEREVHVEKEAPDVFNIVIDDKVIQVPTFQEVLDYIKDNI